MEKINIKINNLHFGEAKKSSNNQSKIGLGKINPTLKTDTFDNKENKKKLIKIGLIIAGLGTVLFALKKHVLPSLKKVNTNNLPSTEKAQPSNKEKEAAAQNIKNNIEKNEKPNPNTKNEPVKKNPEIEQQEIPKKEDSKGAENTVKKEEPEETPIKIEQEIKETPEIKETKEVPEMQEILPQLDFQKFEFNEKVFESLQDYKKVIMSENPQPISKKLLNDCLKEQGRIEKAYDTLSEMWDKTEDEKLKEAISDEFEKLRVRYRELDYAKVAKKTANFKEILDTYDPEAYGKIVARLKEKFSNKGYQCLYAEVMQEVGRRSFKGSPVYKELLAGAQKLNLEGTEEEKIINLIKQSEKHKLGEGEQGIVYHIPETNLAIKLSKSIFSPKKIASLNSFQNLEGLSEYNAVNNVLAKGNGCEIQRYIDGIKQSMLDEDVQKIISDMPQKAYDDFLARAVRINNADRGIDTGACNIIIDAINQRFVPVDLHPDQYVEARYRTANLGLGRSKIDPIAHTLGQFSYSMDEKLEQKRIGKILKAIAKDTKNHEMFLFDTSFYDSKNPQRTIQKYFDFRNLNRDLGVEIDEAFDKLHKLKLELAKSENPQDKEKLHKAIDDFCTLVDEKLLNNSPDLSPKELAQMQIEINTSFEKNKKISELKSEISMCNRFLKALNKKETLTPEEIQEKLEIEEELKKYTNELKKIEE